MRCYVPMSTGELEAFIDSSSARFQTLYLPTLALAEDYGVSDDEEVEYAALEIARAAAESTNKSIVAALEISDSQLATSITDAVASNKEISAGVIAGEFHLTFTEVVAVYLIEEPDEELEWYDASEATSCLAKARR